MKLHRRGGGRAGAGEGRPGWRAQGMPQLARVLHGECCGRAAVTRRLGARKGCAQVTGRGAGRAIGPPWFGDRSKQRLYGALFPNSLAARLPTAPSAPAGQPRCAPWPPQHQPSWQRQRAPAPLRPRSSCPGPSPWLLATLDGQIQAPAGQEKRACKTRREGGGVGACWRRRCWPAENVTSCEQGAPASSFIGSGLNLQQLRAGSRAKKGPGPATTTTTTGD